MQTNDKLLLLLALSKAKNASISSGAFCRQVELGWDWHLAKIGSRKTCANMWDWDERLGCWHVMVNVRQFPEDMWPDFMAHAVQGCVGHPSRPSPAVTLRLPKGFVGDLASIDMPLLLAALARARSADWYVGDDLSNHLPLAWMRSAPSFFRGVSDLGIDKGGLEGIMRDLLPTRFAAETGMVLRKGRQLS